MLLWIMMITMTKSDLSPSLPRSAHYVSAKLMEINFPSYPSVFPIKSALLECSSMAITCQCLFHSIASTWCVHQRRRLLPAPPIWSVPGPWTCVRNLFHTLCDWLPAPQPVFHSGSTLFSSWWIMIYDAVVKVWPPRYSLVANAGGRAFRQELGTYRTVDIFNFSHFSLTILEKLHFLCFYIIKSIARKGYFGPKYP